MVEARMTKAVTNENSESGLGSLRIVKGMDRLIYINHTDMEEGHRYHSIEHTFYVQIIYGYLLTFSTWRLSVNFIPMYCLLVLY
jgi:hypothetical protein